MSSTKKPVRLGPYVLRERIGQGGMAVVYHAMRHGPSGFAKPVVIKTMLPDLAKDPSFVDMFIDEAKLTAQLTHPNIVQVSDFGIERGVPFLVMEHLEGRNLREVAELLATRGGRLPVPAVLAIARELSAALAYAHAFVDRDGTRSVIVHRDVSPANVMICRDGTVKLLDFGVAKILSSVEELTFTFKGKLTYTALEQLEHKQVDRRSDVFSMGVVLHELLTGRRLFLGKDDADTIQRLRSLVVSPPSATVPEVPAALDAIVLRALARDPAARFANAQELYEALEALGGHWPRRELLRYLGEVCPTVWMVSCDECGQRLSFGSECVACVTRARPITAAELSDLLDEGSLELEIVSSAPCPAEDTPTPFPEELTVAEASILHALADADPLPPAPPFVAPAAPPPLPVPTLFAEEDTEVPDLRGKGLPLRHSLAYAGTALLACALLSLGVARVRAAAATSPPAPAAPMAAAPTLDPDLTAFAPPPVTPLVTFARGANVRGKRTTRSRREPRHAAPRLAQDDLEIEALIGTPGSAPEVAVTLPARPRGVNPDR